MTKIVYILNSPVLTAYGQWEFSGPISLEESRSLLSSGYISAVGHASTARLLSGILGIEVSHTRRAISMNPGDEALVFHLHQRLEEHEIVPEQELRSRAFEFGKLRRLA